MHPNVPPTLPKFPITERQLEQAIRRLRPETRWYRPTPGQRLQRRPFASHPGSPAGATQVMSAAAAAPTSSPRRPAPPQPPMPSPRRSLQHSRNSGEEQRHDENYPYHEVEREREQQHRQERPSLVSNISKIKEELFQDRGPMYFSTPYAPPRGRNAPPAHRYENWVSPDNADQPPPVPPRTDLMNRRAGGELTRPPVDSGDSDSYEEYYSTHAETPDPQPPMPPAMPTTPPRASSSYHHNQQQQQREQGQPRPTQSQFRRNSPPRMPPLHYHGPPPMQGPFTDLHSHTHPPQPPRRDYDVPPSQSQQQHFTSPPRPPPRSTSFPPPPPPHHSHSHNPHAYYTAPPAPYVDAFTQMMREQSRQNRTMIARQSAANKLPEFSGNPLEWQLFHSQYTLQSSACNFTAEEDTARMDRSLRGEARQLVQGLLLVRNNPDAIITRLKERYGRPEYVIQALVEVVRKTPAIKNNLGALQDFSASINNLISNIRSLNIPAYLQNPSLLKEMVEKLPDSLRFDWGKYLIGRTSHDLSDFATWMQFNAHASSLVSTPVFHMEDSSRSSYRGKEKRTESNFVVSSSGESDPPETSSAAPAKSQQKPKSNTNAPDCPICKKTKHKLWACDAFKKMDVNERWEIVKKAKFCFKCLSPGHLLTDCKSRSCTVANCNGRHNSLLHGSTVQPKQPANAPSAPPSTPAQTSSSRLEEINGHVNSHNDTAVQLRVLPVKLYGPSGSITVNAILDECSTVTMINAEIAEKIGLVGPIIPLSIEWTNGSRQKDESSMKIVKGLKVGPAGGETKFKLPNARTMKNMKLPATIADYGKILKSYSYFSGIKFHVLHDEAPMILIGQKHSHLTIARGIREGDPSHPMATFTKLGWVVHGNLPPGMEKKDSLINYQHTTFSCIHESEDDLLHNLVKEQFTLEAIGIRNVKSNRSREDKEAEILMENITRKVGGRYETGLLWRNFTGFSSAHHPIQGKPDNGKSIEAGGSSEVYQGAVPVECGPMSAPSATTEEPSIPCRVTSVPKDLGHVAPSVGGSNAGSGFRLPSSRETAFRRMVNLERKFKKMPELLHQFQIKIDDYLTKGYAKKLTTEATAVSSNREWFLPLFGTFHPNKPGKLRLIWDAASKSHKRCLNDFLLTGPDLLNSLPGILLKFRRGKIAFSGDITEMFHQVRIRKEDCPAQRFLWRSNPDEEPSIYQLEVMMFGSVCSPYCAQYVKNKNAEEFANSFPEAASAIISRHYMDDYLESCNSEEEASRLIQEVTHVHKQGGFHISKWIANSPKLMESIPAEERATSMKDLTAWSEIPTERALGLHWNPSTDMLTFRVNLDRAGEGIASGEKIPTKRAILRVLMLVWDPLGILAHYLITARLLIQQLWRCKVGWDDEIPHDIFLSWKKFIRKLSCIREIIMPRHYSPHVPVSQIQLHVFSDASEEAYASVAYLRFAYENGVDVAFVLAKSRVAPLKLATIPRLELQASLIGARMGKFIQEEQGLPISSCHYWTDSGTVLKWLRNEARRFQQFVANRVGEIQEKTDVAQWRWVPTKENPADDATRGGHADLNNSSRWWRGPNFLKKQEAEWPVEPTCHITSESEEELELRNEYVAVQSHPPSFPHLPDISRFSSYSRLLRSTAYVLLFPQLCKWKKAKIGLRPELPLQQAETQLIIRSQWECYGEEMNLLTNHELIPKSSKIYELAPMLDDNGMMRFRTRLATSSEEGLRLPIVLHPKDLLTRLIILHYHQQAHHHSSSFVHNEMRQRFWITSAKTTIKSIVKKCGVCRLRNTKLPKPPIMGNLPHFRIQQQPRPFTIVGMDYFGPLFVTVKRSHEKRYGVLFTCLSTRAVHLEIAHDLTTDACIMAIRRFIGRRGQPKEIHSDNGTNLRGADRELQQSLDQLNQSRMKDELQYQNIDWYFVPPGSPHMAGVWERLVRSVKNALTIILKERFPKDEVLRTVFAEAEAIVNSRPLTDISTDADSPEALTPFHFLIGSSSMLQPPGVFDEKEANWGKKWRQSQALIDMFWKRWRKEYLPTLQLRQKWKDPVPNLEVGDVVVLFDDSLRRGSYPLGLVTGVIPGKDGVVRVVWVKTATGQYKRPTVKVAKIGVRSVGNVGGTEGNIEFFNEGEEYTELAGQVGPRGGAAEAAAEEKEA